MNAAVQSNAPERKTEPRKLIIPRFKQAEYERTPWRASIEAGIGIDDVLRPEFWSHVAAKMKPYDIVEVVAEDGAYYAELLVLSCDRLWAKVQVKTFMELNGPQVDPLLTSPLASGYKVEYKGPTLKHCVIRLSDNEIVQKEIARKADAEVWVAEHVKALAR